MPEIAITPLVDACDIAVEMGIALELAERTVRMGEIFRSVTGHDVEMISGYRTCREQEMLAVRGRPAAPCDISTHTSCPATGADFRLPGLFDTDFVKAQFGSSAIQAGLRWGGGSPVRLVDVGGGQAIEIPSDWNHVDLGRRN